MAASLAAAYRECDGRDDVRAVIFTGAGEGVMAFLEHRAPRWTLAVPRDWPDDA
jgi:enoyl-CoA hydratase/carnithine racemase